MANMWSTLAAGGAPFLTWFGLSLGAAVLWGLQYAFWGQILRTVSPLAGLWWYCLFSFVLYTVFMLVRGVDIEVSKVSVLPVAAMLVAAALIGFAANVGMMSGFKMANPTIVTMITASAPMFTAMFAYLMFRSVQVNVMTLVGFAMILAGVGVVAWSKQA